jgi:hypothetical protein
MFSFMSAASMSRESRRSSRVPLKLTIDVEDLSRRLTCEGETVVVNFHGALVSTTVGLRVGMKISVHVYLTDKDAKARVVYADPENPLRFGIELDRPRNIWGVPLPPADWNEAWDREP